MTSSLDCCLIHTGHELQARISLLVYLAGRTQGFLCHKSVNKRCLALPGLPWTQEGRGHDSETPFLAHHRDTALSEE